MSSTPTAANPRGTVNLGLMEVAYQDPQAWPPLAPNAAPGEAAAAQSFICTALNFCQLADSCSQLRECFWQKYGSEWSDKRTSLVALPYQQSKDFTEATYNVVRAELVKEIGWVVSVQGYVRRLQEPLDRSAVGSYVDLQDVGDKIYNALQPDPVNNSTSWILGLVGKVISLGSFAGPPASAGAAGLAAVFGLGSYLSNKQGQPILGTEIKVKSRALAQEMLDRLQLARKTTTGLGMLIVSDYGKLAAAYRHIDSDWSLGDSEVLSNNLRTAARQWYWEALMPTAYPYLLRGNGMNARSLDCRMEGRAGWPNQPDAFQMAATVGYNSDGSPIKAIFFFTRGIGGGSSPDARKLDDEIFRPRDAAKPGLGIEKLSFFSARVWGGRILHAVSGTRGCSVEWLPNFF